jgi:hypothetical protein
MGEKTSSIEEVFKCRTFQQSEKFETIETKTEQG